jgi:hypothetical protein
MTSNQYLLTGPGLRFHQRFGRFTWHPTPWKMKSLGVIVSSPRQAACGERGLAIFSEPPSRFPQQ